MKFVNLCVGDAMLCQQPCDNERPVTELKSKAKTKHGLRVNVTHNIQWPTVGVWGKRPLYGPFNRLSSFPHI
jgi:hypothetical protein